MVGMLGHNVGRVFMLVFGVGAGLAAVAGVIAGPALVTQSTMAERRLAPSCLLLWL
jgi:branched-chain amino acid transport system permease protein